MDDEYVSRKAVIDAVCSHWCDSSRTIEAIRNIIAADVAPVVRCRECIHWENWGACAHPENGWDAFLMNPDDFCSRGERSTDNSTQK